MRPLTTGLYLNIHPCYSQTCADADACLLIPVRVRTSMVCIMKSCAASWASNKNNNVSTIRDSERSLIMMNMKSTRAFQRVIGGVRTLPLSPRRVAQKTIFVFF